MRKLTLLTTALLLTSSLALYFNESSPHAYKSEEINLVNLSIKKLQTFKKLKKTLPNFSVRG